jgi:hypothetical protein
MKRLAMRVLVNRHKLHLLRYQLTCKTRSNNKAIEVHASNPFGVKSHDDALWVQEAGIMGIPIHHLMALPRRGTLRPKHKGYVSAILEHLLGFFWTIAIS